MHGPLNVKFRYFLIVIIRESLYQSKLFPSKWSGIWGAVTH